jgi:hypothetical protein
MIKTAFKRLALPTLAVLLAGAAWAAPAPLDDDVLNKLTDGADLIVLGKVVEMGQPGDGTTWMNIKVKEILKGATSTDTVTVIVPGGGVRGSNTPLTVSGQPHFQAKELTIVFLSASGDHFEVYGAENGKQPGEGPEAKRLQSAIKRYLTKKPLL